jgi:S1-C subfamily serine protease
MMKDLTLLDGLVILGIVLFVLAGLRRGLLRAGGALIGLIVGIVAALAVGPWVASQISDATTRAILVVLSVVVLLSVCSGIGARIGGAVRRAVSWRPVRFVDAIAGGALHLGMALLFVSMVTFAANSLGISAVSRTVAASPVLQGIQRGTPAEVQKLFAQVRSTTVATTLPQVTGQALPGSVKAGSDSAVQTDAVVAATASVVRVSGVAAQCSQSQFGSGFVVASDRVVTNAHVVAGVSDVVVEIPGSEAVSGRVVYYNAVKDLAVIATDGLQAQPLEIASGASTGETVAFAGYPLGGPLALRAGAVQGLSTIQIKESTTTVRHGLQVYSLAGNVEQGNSGGPLLNLQGQVVGTIFAKSTSQADVGYALTMTEVKPVIDAAATYTETVDDGTCVTG